MIAFVVSSLEMLPKGLEKQWGTRDQRKNRDHPDHSSVKIKWDTKENPVDSVEPCCYTDFSA